MKELLILGSTGSVGSSTIEIVAANPLKYKAKTLVGGSNVKKLAMQAIRCNAANVVIADEASYHILVDLLSAYPHINVSAGSNAVLDLAAENYDISVACISGIAGLAPIMRAMPNSHILALANKESLICAGNLLLSAAHKYNTHIIPVDSEHNAIFRILNDSEIKLGGERGVEKITLTASGGPFWNKSLGEMASTTPEAAVAHKIWDMGAKISVDSATMMNKGLEIIEASYLFSLPISAIEVVVHPEGIMHGAVHYIDGAAVCCLAYPDMKLPISYALAYPCNDSAIRTLNFTEISSLSFYEPNHLKFPLLNVARKAAESGQEAIIVMNAANEVAVNAFLENRISFMMIQQIVLAALDKLAAYKACSNRMESLEDILNLHKNVQRDVERVLTVQKD